MVAPIAATSGSDSTYVGDVYPGTSSTLNDTVSSIKNDKSGYDVVWYFNAGYAGTSYCLDSGHSASYLQSHNDKYSAHQVVSGGTC